MKYIKSSNNDTFQQEVAKQYLYDKLRLECLTIIDLIKHLFVFIFLHFVSLMKKSGSSQDKTRHDTFDRLESLVYQN